MREINGTIHQLVIKELCSGWAETWVSSEEDAEWETTDWSLARNLGAQSLRLVEDGELLGVAPDE
jgi:hypothetical protein